MVNSTYTNFLNYIKFPLLAHMLVDKELDCHLIIKNKIQTPTNMWNILPKAKEKEMPLTLQEYLDKFGYHSNWSWREDIIFSEKDLDNNISVLTKTPSGFKKFCSNPNFIWTHQRIKKYEKYICFKELSSNPSLLLDEYRINDYYNLFNKNNLATNPYVAREHPSIINRLARERNQNLCENPELIVDLDFFERNKNWLDLWNIAKYAKIDLEVFNKYGDLFNLSRKSGIVTYKHSDWWDDYDVVTNAWENLMSNRNFICDIDMLKILSKYEVTLTKHSSYITENNVSEMRRLPGTITFDIPVCQIIPAEKIKLDFHDFVYNYKYFHKSIISEFNMHLEIYTSIVKPFIIKHSNLIGDLFFNYQPTEKHPLLNEKLFKPIEGKIKNYKVIYEGKF